MRVEIPTYFHIWSWHSSIPYVLSSSLLCSVFLSWNTLRWWTVSRPAELTKRFPDKSAQSLFLNKDFPSECCFKRRDLRQHTEERLEEWSRPKTCFAGEWNRLYCNYVYPKSSFYVDNKMLVDRSERWISTEWRGGKDVARALRWLFPAR